MDERLHPEIHIENWFNRFNEYPVCFRCKQPMTPNQAKEKKITYVGGMADGFVHRGCKIKSNTILKDEQ